MTNLTAPNGERIVFVEYEPGTTRAGSVVAVDDSGRSHTSWNFFYCQRDGQLYYDQCGGGFFDGTELLHKMIGGWRWVWWDHGFVRPVVTARKWWLPFLWPRARYRRYYARPLWFGWLDLWRMNAQRVPGMLRANPFDGALECRVVYCTVCDDWLPDDCDQPCEHLEWSDEDGEFVGTGAVEVPA